VVAFLDAVRLDIAAAELVPRGNDMPPDECASHITEAAQAYERVLISEPAAPLDVFINLAFLYWQSTDFGFWSGVGLPLPFVKMADSRRRAVFDQAEKIYPANADIRFWRRYFDFITLGEPPFEEECKKLLQESGASLVPYFYLYSSPGEETYERQADELFHVCEKTPTMKNRYIMSVISGATQGHQWAREELTR